MKSYAERHYFPRKVRRAFHLVTYVVDGLKARDPEIRCHELAIAVATILRDEIGGLMPIVWTGHYGAVEHSWLRVSTHELNRHILDVYAVGRMPQVQLIDGSALLPEFKLYKIGEERTDIDRKIVRELIAEMHEYLRLGRSVPRVEWDPTLTLLELLEQVES